MRHVAWRDSCVGRAVARPQYFAGRCFQAVQLSLSAIRVDLAVNKRGSSARAGSSEGFFKPDGIFVNPNLVARFGVVTGNDFLFATLLLSDEMAVDDDQARPGWSDFPSPEQFGRMLFPICRERNAGDDAIAIWAAVFKAIAELRRPRLAFRLLHRVFLRVLSTRQESGLVRRNPSPTQVWLLGSV